MYPEIAHWGFLHIRSYGLMLAIAFLVGTWLGIKEARRLGLDPDQLVTVILATLVSSVLGARLLYVLEHVDEFRAQWGSVLAVWQGGLTLYGGVVAGTVVGLATARRLKMPMWSVRKRTRAPGTLFWGFIVAFAIGRAALDFFRAYEPSARVGTIAGLDITESQLVSLSMALFGVLMMFRLRRDWRAAGAPAVAVTTAPSVGAPHAAAAPPVPPAPPAAPPVSGTP